jgi:hypothetical protein
MPAALASVQPAPGKRGLRAGPHGMPRGRDALQHSPFMPRLRSALSLLENSSLQDYSIVFEHKRISFFTRSLATSWTFPRMELPASP